MSVEYELQVSRWRMRHAGLGCIIREDTESNKRVEGCKR